MFQWSVFVCEFKGYIVCQADVVGIGEGVGCSYPVGVLCLVGWPFDLLQVRRSRVGCWSFREGALELVVCVQVFEGNPHPCLSN